MICECLWQSPSCDQILPFVHLNTKLLAVFYLRLVPEKPVKSCQILCLVWFWLILFSAGRFAWLTSILLPNSLSSKPRIYEAGSEVPLNTCSLVVPDTISLHFFYLSMHSGFQTWKYTLLLLLLLLPLILSLTEFVLCHRENVTCFSEYPWKSDSRFPKL